MGHLTFHEVSNFYPDI